jgi:uncharacterized protein (DUF1330 family)
MVAYLIAGINRISDPETFAGYQSRSVPSFEAYGGKLIAGAPSERLEGDWQPMVNIIVEFPNMETLREWYNSDVYRELIPIRQGAADVDITIVDGT